MSVQRVSSRVKNLKIEREIPLEVHSVLKILILVMITIVKLQNHRLNHIEKKKKHYTKSILLEWIIINPILLLLSLFFSREKNEFHY